LFGGVFTRSGPIRVEDLYQEPHSSEAVDLLSFPQRQRTPEREPEELPTGSVPQYINLRTLAPLKDRIRSLLSESDVPLSAADIAEELLKSGQYTPPAAGMRAAFSRLVPGALSENSKRVIGENGVRRFEEFKQYHDGWDHGRGKPLSAHSVATLEEFLRQMPELATVEPSLFLTHNGNVQLGWEDAERNAVEVEFFPDRIEYYIESRDEEGSVRKQALHQLINQVRPTIP
jgi:hypothetical protein